MKKLYDRTVFVLVCALAGIGLAACTDSIEEQPTTLVAPDGLVIKCYRVSRGFGSDHYIYVVGNSASNNYDVQAGKSKFTESVTTIQVESPK